MTVEEIRKEIETILAVTDVDRYPELYASLSALSETDDEGLSDEMMVAASLAETDEAMAMPEGVFRFIARLYKSEASRGNTDAMNDLGALYYDGRGVEQDYKKAVYWYTLASEHGNRQAQENLGYCYYYGRLGEPDYAKAYHYFVMGALDGHIISLYKIGDMYKNGLYVPKNGKEAFAIYTRCIETMTEEAAPKCAGPVFLRLGDCYYYGIGTEKDLDRALESYQRAELFLGDMVKSGDFMYMKSLEAAIEGEENARKERLEALPKGY